jgi:hypothetical protein
VVSWLDLSARSSPGDAGDAAALVLATQEFWLTVEGDRQVVAAKVLLRQDGRAAVAVSVGVAVGVPLQNSPSRR